MTRRRSPPLSHPAGRNRKRKTLRYSAGNDSRAADRFQIVDSLAGQRRCDTAPAEGVGDIDGPDVAVQPLLFPDDLRKRRLVQLAGCGTGDFTVDDGKERRQTPLLAAGSDERQVPCHRIGPVTTSSPFPFKALLARMGWKSDRRFSSASRTKLPFHTRAFTDATFEARLPQRRQVPQRSGAALCRGWRSAQRRRSRPGP